jgi:hypothetical protein
MVGEQICLTCGQTKNWHDEHSTIHQFSAVDGQIHRRSSQIKVSQLPTDPVLRVALIDNGILTVEQLTAAEAKIDALSRVGKGDPGDSADRARAVPE